MGVSVRIAARPEPVVVGRVLCRPESSTSYSQELIKLQASVAGHLSEENPNVDELRDIFKQMSSKLRPSDRTGNLRLYYNTSTIQVTITRMSRRFVVRVCKGDAVSTYTLENNGDKLPDGP